MEETEKACESEDNYFDATTRSMNTSPVPEDATSEPAIQDQVKRDTPKEDQQHNLHTQNPPESLTEDTSQTPEEPEDTRKPQNQSLNNDHQEKTPTVEEKDDFHTEDIEATETAEESDYDQETDIDSYSECTVILTANTHMEASATDNIPTSIEEVGCTFVTTCLCKFLEHLSSLTNKQISEELYYMLSVLDQYLYDNLAGILTACEQIMNL